MASWAHFEAATPPGADLCLSAFLVSIDDDGLLLGRMGDLAAWSALDQVTTTVDPGEGWVLPAAHLRIGEGPDAAALRVVRDQLRANLQDLRLHRVLSFAAPLPARDPTVHWDLCFVYDADLDVPSTPPWFHELRRVPLPELEGLPSARGHGDVLAALGLGPRE